MSEKLTEFDSYKDIFSLENFPMFKTVMDVFFDNYDGSKVEFLNVIIMNKQVFGMMTNDVVGHRILKIVVKKNHTIGRLK